MSKRALPAGTTPEPPTKHARRCSETLTLDENEDENTTKQLTLRHEEGAEFKISKAHLSVCKDGVWAHVLDDQDAKVIPVAAQSMSEAAFTIVVQFVESWAGAVPDVPSKIRPGHRTLRDMASEDDARRLDELTEDELVEVLLAANYVGLRALEKLVLVALALRPRIRQVRGVCCPALPFGRCFPRSDVSTCDVL